MELCWAMASPCFEVQEPLQNIRFSVHTSRNSAPHPEFCYEMSWVCSMMAYDVLESFECVNSGHLFIRAYYACSW
jgi:hypothetical protein